MSDFSVGAELSVVVPRRELRSARQEVEDALAEIPVGMSASGGGTGGSATNAAREQRRRRREFRWARQRTDDTEAQLEVLENIEGELTEGGFGGGGDIISSVTDIGGEAAGIASDVGTTLVEALPSALGSFAGTALGQQGVGGGGGQTERDITVDPTIAPEINNNFDPDFSPSFKPNFSPTFKPTFDPETNILPKLKELNLGGGGSGLSEPVNVIVTNTPISVKNTRRDNRRALRRNFKRTTNIGVSGGNNGITVPEREGEPLGLETIVETALFGGTAGATAGFAVGGPVGAGIGAAGGAGLGALGGIGAVGIDRLQGRFGGESILGGSTDNISITRETSVEASTGDVNVTVNADVQSAVQNAIDELRREQDRQRQELRRELQNEIDGLRREISGGPQGRGFRR